MGLLTQTPEPAKDILGVEAIAVVADKGYFKIEDIKACERAGMVPYVPRPQRGPSVKAGLFRKDEFSYDVGNNSFVCPAGQRLHPYTSSFLRGLSKISPGRSAQSPEIATSNRCFPSNHFSGSPAPRRELPPVYFNSIIA